MSDVVADGIGNTMAYIAKTVQGAARAYKPDAEAHQERFAKMFEDFVNSDRVQEFLESEG
jgi:hypothetical protein